MTDEQTERLIAVFERIAIIMEAEYAAKYPIKPPVRDADVTYVKTEEEQLRENLGETGEETIEDWTNLGPRERAFIAKERGQRQR